MLSAQYFCLILPKFGLSRQIFMEVSDIKFHENPSNRSRADTGKRRQTEGQT
jgi:hypothetical protein